MKFSAVVKGTRATKTFDLPLVGPPGEALPSIKVTTRVLAGEEIAEVLEAAVEFARGRGSKDPQSGEPLYELGLRAHTLLRAYVDADAADIESPDARFFESVEQILGSHQLGRDGIWFLYEAHEAWQDHCSPQPTKLGEGQYWAEVVALAASNDPLDFARLRPGLQWSLARFMAEQLLLLRSPKSPSGSPIEIDSPVKSNGSEKQPSASVSSTNSTEPTSEP